MHDRSYQTSNPGQVVSNPIAILKCDVILIAPDQDCGPHKLVEEGRHINLKASVLHWLITRSC